MPPTATDPAADPVPAASDPAANANAALARRAHGVFYTPEPLANRVAEIALAGAGPSGSADESVGEHTLPTRVLDPACGTGNLLLAVGRALHVRGLDWATIVTRLHGVDIDPEAIATARARILAAAGHSVDVDQLSALLQQNLVCADALSPSLPAPFATPFDLVIGNPPFGSAIDKRTGRDDAQREAYAAAYPNAAKGAYDKASLFVERALQFANKRVALILPRAILAATYADRLRTYVDAEHALSDVLRIRKSDHFVDASVYVTAVFLNVRPPQRRAGVQMWNLTGSPAPAPRPRDGRWSVLLSPHAAVINAIPDDWIRLDTVTHLQAGASTGEAYDFIPGVSETHTPGAWKLVTTGSIDPFVCLWGTRKTRYLKRDLTTPWLARSVVSARRAALYDQPKVLVAGLSKVLEAVVDDGACAGAVATLAVTVKGGACGGDDVNGDGSVMSRLHTLCAFLNSDVARTQYLALHGAQALGGGSVQVTKRKLGELRLPPDWAAISDWAAVATALGATGVTP